MSDANIQGGGGQQRKTVDEHRQHERATIDLALEFVRKDARGADARVPGKVRDISLGGMFIQTTSPPPFGAEILIHVSFGPRKAAFVLPGVVRWTRDDGMGIQFLPLGARETHALMELTKTPGA